MGTVSETLRSVVSGIRARPAVSREENVLKLVWEAKTVEPAREMDICK